jgi:hypothetical protein
MGDSSRKITLRLSEDELELEILADGPKDLERAYLEIVNAQTELRRIRRRHELDQLAQALKEASKQHWIETEGAKRIDESLETPLRIALSYLDSYPECKQGLTVAAEAGCSSAAVTRYASGDLGNHKQFFDKCNGEWKLSDEGLSFISRSLGASHEGE